MDFPFAWIIPQIPRTLEYLSEKKEKQKAAMTFKTKRFIFRSTYILNIKFILKIEGQMFNQICSQNNYPYVYS